MNKHIRRARIGRHMWSFTEPTFLDHLIQAGSLVFMKPHVYHVTKILTIIFRTQRP